MDMEQNKEIQQTEQASESSTAQTVAEQPQEAVQQMVEPSPAPEQPEKKKPAVLFVVAGLALLLVVLVVLFVSGIFGKDPKKAVNDAIDATQKQSEARIERMSAEVPAAKFLMDTSVKSEKSDFALEFQSLEGGDTSLQIVSKLLSGFGLNGTVVTDPENGVMELDGSIAMSGSDLLGLYFFLSPDTYAGGIPTFTDTMVSINPQTFAEDMRASRFYDPQSMPDDQLEELQEVLTAQAGMLQSAGGLDVKAMQADIRNILLDALENATYQKTGKDGANTVYEVKIPGADVKNTLIQLVRYLYIDSPLGQIYDNAFPAEMLDGKRYSEMVEEEMLPAIEENMPEMDATLVFQINKTVRSVKADFVPNDGGASGFEHILADISYNENGDTAMTLSMGFSNQEKGKLSVSAEASDSYADGVYGMSLKFDLSGETEGVPVSVQIGEQLTMDKDGRYALDFDMGFDGMDMDIGQPMPSFGFQLDGTVTTDDGGNTTWDFPTFAGKMDYLGESYMLNFTCKSTSSPITGPYEASRTLTPLFGMEEAALEAWVSEYQAGVEALFGSLFGFGTGSAAAVPEPGLPAA